MIEIKNLSKIFPTKEKDFNALKDISVTFDSGEFVAVLGESGSGKTTMLNMISGIDSYTSGSIIFNDKDTKKFTDSKWRKIRNQEIGFIFQRFNLIDHLSVLDNVTLPLILTGSDKDVANEIALKILKEVELENVGHKLASELSGGQRQRVAIARTIIINPTIILADEPTGALDSTTGIQIMKLLQKFAPGRTIIMVTHDEKLAYENATRVIRLSDGEIISDEATGRKNSATDNSIIDLLTHSTVVTRRKRKSILKTYPELDSLLVVGNKVDIPTDRKYTSMRGGFSKYIAKKNYLQNKKVNFKIIMSFIISIALLLIVNIVIKNMTEYNYNLFDINNDYEQYLVESYDGDGTAIINTLSETSNVNESGHYYKQYVNDMYFIDTDLVEADQILQVSNDIGNYDITEEFYMNSGILSPKMVSLPKKQSNFYLNDEIIAGSYPTAENEIIVSSEFMYTRFYGISLDSNVAVDADAVVPSLNSMIGKSLYICGQTPYEQDVELVTGKLDEVCREYTVTGILNSYYKGINYSGNIFMAQEDFESYIDYLSIDLEYSNVDEFYDEYVYFYLDDFDKGIDEDAFETEYNVSIVNEELSEYKQVGTLREMVDFLYIAIFASLIIICGTIDINIVSSNILSRIKEVGIYSCIGVSKKSIRGIFINEVFMMGIRILLFDIVVYGIVALFHKITYKLIVVDLSDLRTMFGSNDYVSYELFFSLGVIAASIMFLIVIVLVPSYRATNLKAIDALRGE